jgi:hypothetical protein
VRLLEFFQHVMLALFIRRRFTHLLWGEVSILDRSHGLTYLLLVVKLDARGVSCEDEDFWNGGLPSSSRPFPSSPRQGRSAWSFPARAWSCRCGDDA